LRRWTGARCKAMGVLGEVTVGRLAGVVAMMVA